MNITIVLCQLSAFATNIISQEKKCITLSAQHEFSWSCLHAACCRQSRQFAEKASWNVFVFYITVIWTRQKSMWISNSSLEVDRHDKTVLFLQGNGIVCDKDLEAIVLGSTGIVCYFEVISSRNLHYFSLFDMNDKFYLVKIIFIIWISQLHKE